MPPNHLSVHIKRVISHSHVNKVRPFQMGSIESESGSSYVKHATLKHYFGLRLGDAGTSN